MYEGRTDVKQGKVLARRTRALWWPSATAVGRIELDDRVSPPFNNAGGTCEYCVKSLTGFGLRANAGNAAPTATPGVGTYADGQAEFLRVPWAEFKRCLAR